MPNNLIWKKNEQGKTYFSSYKIVDDMKLKLIIWAAGHIRQSYFNKKKQVQDIEN